MAKTRKPKLRTRFGIAEWYGKDFTTLLGAERRRLAQAQLSDEGKSSEPCPFKPGGGLCNKASGICSIRPYREMEGTDGEISVAPIFGDQGRPRATCPNRFHQNKTAYEVAGDLLLGNSQPILVPEVGFLEPVRPRASGVRKTEVGRIDLVLMDEEDSAGTTNWGALEIQAVYFSGKGMKADFQAIYGAGEDTIVLPAHSRRPDYRSSSAKRLLPQLQTKVPTLRRWGKKIAVVVDEYFFGDLDPMSFETDLSSADIAWIVVRFDPVGGSFVLAPHEIRLTTLEEAVNGLTGGRPTTQSNFLARLKEKAARNLPLEFEDNGEELGGDCE